jgi:hypothetical protein
MMTERMSLNNADILSRFPRTGTEEVEYTQVMFKMKVFWLPNEAGV